MSTCIALLAGPLDHKHMEGWFTTDLFQAHILHVEALRNISVAAGALEADPFGIPSSIDTRDIAGLAIFDCETKIVSRYGFQVPALGIACLAEQNVLCLRGWCDEAPTVEEYESDCCLLDDPCELYKELRCCYLKLVKEQEKVSVTFRERSVRFQPKSEQDKVRLMEMMLEAKAECECNSDWRGGPMGHSCVPRFKPKIIKRCC